ncbi:hypothetical protein [Mangrovibacterium marinum]|uniref:Thioredoxin 1 n=1 Tax=Mangrovibacterium marinum TaxID=1639118 RepID=A0A2T5BZH5_9BACT|nr:hypothetical protein [Mangrovibacterium marinum]PTN07689.1 thioredoxin 1 [Mangrovibacterium marinum]
MLHTNLKHVLSAADHQKLIAENENVMICCGRMGPMCVPVYAAMTKLESQFPQVVFADMEFDIPDAAVIRDAPQCRNFMGLPFVMYYKNGKVAHASSSILSTAQIEAVLHEKLLK